VDLEDSEAKNGCAGKGYLTDRPYFYFQGKLLKEIYGHESQRDSKPRITLLAHAVRKLTACLHPVKGQLVRSACSSHPVG
jgi:hypothetical protein